MAVKRCLRFSGQMEAEIFTILNHFFTPVSFCKLHGKTKSLIDDGQLYLMSFLPWVTEIMFGKKNYIAYVKTRHFSKVNNNF